MYGRGESSQADPSLEKPAIHRTTSEDFETWSDFDPVLVPTERDVGFPGLAAFRYEGLYLGLLWVRDHAGSNAAISAELTVSRDGIDWGHPFPGEPILEPGSDGVWDGRTLVTPVAPVVYDDTVWFFYGGQNISYGRQPLNRAQSGWIEDEQRKQRAIGLATLGLDGFVSLAGGDEGGSVLTASVEFGGNDLYVNLDAEMGDARVELLDDSGRPYPGFDRAAAVPLTDDTIRQPVRWRSEAQFSDLNGHTGRVRIHLRNADLYAIWTER